MAPAAKPRNLASAILTIAISAVLIWFGNGLAPWWPLMWLAPLPILIFAESNTSIRSAQVAFYSLLLGSMNMSHYFQILQSPGYVWFIVFASVGLVWTFATLLFRALLLRGAAWSAVFAFPSTWVTFEYVRNLYTPHGTAGSLAYTQLQFLPFLQLASITGPWGLSFFILLLPSALAIAWHLRIQSPRQAWRVLEISLGVIALILIFGFIRLAQPQPGKSVTVGLIASDLDQNLHAPTGPATERLFHDYSIYAKQLAAQGAKAIVIPEKTGTITDPNNAPSDAVLQSVADSTETIIITGVVHKASPVQYNEARIYQPHKPVLLYDKHDMLPPFESIFTPGTTITTIHTPQATWGVAICKDMDFTQPSRDYGNAGVGLLFDPGWDFNIDRGWHGHIAIMRGVENGFSIAHSAKNGYLTVTDDRGRILAETRSDSSAFTTLLATVPEGHDPTLYLRFGDWFAWLSIALFLGVLLHYCMVRNRTQQAF
ncbi:nitrilase-related carbon-nitrogen hydrolase [Acidicapsa dinghuensis]|uniref:Nitrilase-related carbon-nitrogen hydrolase n=1 Tax=Acidicapsa dinghuensis TaxID=2218256 RepID=A0ABW1EFP2_9BACT|nr:nitrilase-related carbon-nitrogen hydrolase [Acidicapsa dinghuensis]